MGVEKSETGREGRRTEGEERRGESKGDRRGGRKGRGEDYRRGQEWEGTVGGDKWVGVGRGR